MTSSALDRTICESLEALKRSEPTPAELHDMREAQRMTIPERLRLMDELSALAAALDPGAVKHEPIRGRRFLL